LRSLRLYLPQDRLLNAYLSGTVDEDVYKAKTNELKAEVANVDATLAQMGKVDPARGELAVNLFDWTQKAAEVRRGSNNAVRRGILNSVCLNRTVGDVNLCLEKRKPFGIFAERPLLKNSRDGKTPLELFLVGLQGWSWVLRYQFPGENVAQ
jgi:site-specific DNA recombinase